VFNPEELIYVFKLKRAKVRGNNLMASCPMGLHDDSHPSFGINLDTGQWNCYSCGERGSNIRTLAFVLKIMLPDTLTMQSLSLAPRKKNDSVPYHVYPIDKTFDNHAEAHNALKDRGISKVAIKRFKVGFYNGAIKFPCILPDKKMYGWIERNPKWDGRYGYKPRDVNRKWLLFGADRYIETMYLLESMTDTLKLITWGFEAVSTCGNMLFKEQARIILEYAEKVVLVPQNDKPAKLWIRDCKNLLKGKIPLFGIVINKEFKDICTEGYEKEDWLEDMENRRLI
jgi:DNA primase